jgi:regulator of RNase E activity RraA
MKISLKALNNRRSEIDKLIIESVDLSLYIARAIVAGEEYVVADADGRLLKTHNLLAMKRLLKKCSDCEMVLRQSSAYDEMVGNPFQGGQNTLEISLGREPLPEWLQ